MRDTLNRINPRIYIFISGLMIGLSIIFSSLGLLSYIALIPLAYAIYNRANAGEYKAKKAYFDGLIFYMTFDLVAFHWFIYFYPLDFAGLGNIESVGVVLIAWIGLSALQSVFSALTFVVASKFVKTVIYQKYPALLAFVMASLFAINEWTQTFTWAGVPWARIAISQVEYPILMQSASLFGSYFLTFVVVLFNFLVAYAIFFASKKRVAAIVALLVILCNTLFGSALYFVPGVDSSREIKVASIQGNIDSKNIYIAPIDILEVYDDLTRKAADDGAELIVWPEGAFSVDIKTAVKIPGQSYVFLSDAISSIAMELGVTIVVGSYVESDDITNTSISVFYPDGNQAINAYAKRRPVPFGEYLPLASLVYAVAPTLSMINVFSEITPGEKSSYFNAGTNNGSIKVGTLICFDSIYEALAIDSAREGAEIFIVPSDDSWFYDSRALYMHHSQNILRAVEQGKYTVNCANTGITSVLNNKGEVINDMPIYTRGYVIDTVYASSGRTLYSYIGNLFVYLCIIAVIIPFAFEFYSKKKSKF